MSVPLPSVIQLSPLNPPLNKDENKDDEKQQNKRVILCITRDIGEDDMAILKDYGRVLDYDHDLHNNLDCDTFDWAYLIIDLRESEARYYYMKHIVPNKERYFIAVYHYPFEQEEDLTEAENYFTSFPKKQATKPVFDDLLLMKRVKKPRAVVSLFKCCLNLYSKVK
jgi:hypothetical protein